ncbi:MAG: aminotransferase class V-fold PLP-dependent enzyme [Oscillospiraceae bacterium]|nr:aminotransferase class V-fold PLP-dependent enzyme [Oscillospiraceae bacterium]
MIYLDSAATSLLKPPSVASAVYRAIQSCATPGRGTHAAAMRASDVALSCREEAAALFHMREPEKVVFTMNATHGLNIAIRSLVPPGGRVLISGWEHNAVLRPLYALGAEIEVAASPLFDPEAALRAFREKLGGQCAVICSHVSNVFGFILPVEEIAALCRERGVPMIIDASQSAGVLDLDFPATGAAFCAMPGHKGLLGPQGTGLLLCAGSAEPLLTGGTGGRSESHTMPEELPDRLEAGTQNICGAAGLLAGLRAVRAMGPEGVRRREQPIFAFLRRGLQSLPGLRVFAAETAGVQTAVLSVVPESMSCETMADALGRAGIAVRAGLHCAPLAHTTAGTLATGTLRLSLSPYNTRREMERCVAAMEKILKN